MKIKRWLPLLLLAALMLIAARPMQGELPDWADLVAVLTWIAVQGGGPAIVVAALSWIVENWPKWHELPKWVKFWVPMLSSILLSALATLALDYLPDVVATISPYWRFIITAALTWLASQGAYVAAKSRGYGMDVGTGMGSG